MTTSSRRPQGQYKSYDPAVLRQTQLALTRILAEVDRVCRLLDIPYVVYGGTAIGAVRHGGFVPWDDDADVCMSRAAYERFLREAPAVIGPEFTVDSMRTHADFPATYAYLGQKGTAFVPEFYRTLSYRRPLAVDIFPLDNMPGDERAYRRQSRRTWLWGRLLILRATPTPHVELSGPKRALVLTATRIAHWGLRTLRVSPRFLQARWERAARQYEHESTAQMADYSDRDPRAWAASTDDLYPASDAPFEDITVKLPRNVDAVLRRGYGDYMTLPPADKRKNHYPYLLELPEG
ncbi:MAG: LicD family protein [Propioniciclava sp.]|uniref:LicD family protein n=1 Tax=Propioniciclava sp. TaxID=2038686 RepID=UPI0039E49795